MSFYKEFLIGFGIFLVIINFFIILGASWGFKTEYRDKRIDDYIRTALAVWICNLVNLLMFIDYINKGIVDGKISEILIYTAGVAVIWIVGLFKLSCCFFTRK